MARVILTLATISLLAAAGCASPTVRKWVYEKPGVTLAQWQRDQSQCYAAASATPPSEPAAVGQMHPKVYNDCMQARGYVLKPVS